MEERCHAFIDFLALNGIQAQSKGILNRQFVRIAILGGMLDVYNTPKKSFHLYMHNFADRKTQERVETLWREFTNPDEQTVTGRATNDSFEQIDEYYARLKPYADKAFDFYPFAATLAQMADSPETQFDPEPLRYDFAKLEALYKYFKERYERLS